MPIVAKVASPLDLMDFKAKKASRSAAPHTGLDLLGFPGVAVVGYLAIILLAVRRLFA